jgi:hypothetical protein
MFPSIVVTGNYEWETINEWDVLSMGSIVSQEYPN